MLPRFVAGGQISDWMRWVVFFYLAPLPVVTIAFIWCVVDRRRTASRRQRCYCVWYIHCHVLFIVGHML